MTLERARRIFRRRIWYFLIAAATGLVVGTTLGALKPAEYESTSTLYISSQIGDSAEALYQGSLLTQQRVSSYTDLVTSDRVIGEVRTQLGIQEPVAQVARRVTASNAPDSVLIEIKGSGEDPESAAALTGSVDTEFVKLVNEIERPARPGAAQPVEVRVVQPATLPSEPSSLPSTAIALIGLLAGAIVGIGAVALIEVLDRTIKDAQDLEHVSSYPILSQLPKTANAQALVGQQESPVQWSESFRHLRTNLQYLDVDIRRRVLCVTSAVAAEGKTSVSSNLAIACALAGMRTLLLDGDLRRPAVARALNLEPSVGVSSILSGRITLDQATQRWSGNLSVLASGPRPPNPAEMLGSSQMASLIRELRERYDMVIIDTPPALPVSDTSALTPSVDGVVLVVRAGMTTSTQVKAAFSSLEQVSAPILGSIVNGVRRTDLRAYGKYGPYIEDLAIEDPRSKDYMSTPPSTPGGSADGRPTPQPRTR